MHPETVSYDVMSPVKFLARSVRVFPDKTAVVHGDKRFTYREFQERIFCLARALQKTGVAPGDKVAFLCPNTPHLLEAHYAVPMIGAALVSVNVRLNAEEVAYILDHSDTKVLFVDNELSHLVAPSRSRLSKLALAVNICDASPERPLAGPDYEEFLERGADAPPSIHLDDELQTLAINYTSGTTGLPKGVMYHHRGAFLNALGETIEFGLTSRSVYLWTLPMFHCNGWCFTWAVTAVGGTHVCLRKVEPAAVFSLAATEGVSHLCAAPTVLVGLSEYASRHGITLSRPLSIMTAGAPPAPEVIRNMEQIGAQITQTYGLTEVFGPHSVCEWQEKWDGLSLAERAELKARQGVPYVNALHMEVLDPVTMEPVPEDGASMGEICMRGNNVMSGYYKDPQATAAAFAGGWFHSGDLAVRHPDGYVQIMDRKKDIIISGGENISTVQIENTLYQHPAVSEAAVIAVPDPKWGEVPKAFVVLKEGRQANEEEIIAFCKQSMARFKAPKYVQFGPLPKTGTGKIMKYKLRETEWAGRTKKVA
ncbi:MAG: acyl--CoA ligase family protein [Thermodesulfobacteriota bacterium]